MGMNCVDLRKLPLEKCFRATLPLTKKGVLGTKSMGELSVIFKLTGRTLEEKQIVRARKICFICICSS